MRIQPRQQLLDIWRAASRASFRTGKSGGWTWGGRLEANSVADAEQLLCMLFPATEIPRFRLDKPNETEGDVLSALKVMGSALEIPRLLVRVITDYLQRYSDADGTPIFSGGSYFVPLEDKEATEEQNGFDVVESYAASITLMLSALGFAKIFKAELTRDELKTEVETLEKLANRRLSAAMVGLLRSFSILVFEADEPYGQALLRTVNQERQPQKRVVEELLASLRETAAGLRDLTYGVAQIDDLEVSGQLFECGWSWGVTKNAPQIDWAVNAGKQRVGYAIDAPYLYFTVVALDGIADLFTPRTRLLGLLDDDQQRLATALQKRWDLTQKYWSTIAAFGPGNRWPLEDIPWRTVDELESDFFSLLVTSIAARDLAERRGSDADLSRLGRILIELANRARITRRPFRNDPAVKMHDPGVAMLLEGIEDFGPPQGWVASDFAPLLLKRTIRTAGLINDTKLRGTLLELADDIWDHVAKRRIDAAEGKDLWDLPAGAFPELEKGSLQPSWHHTLRVVESLVIAANLADTHPLSTDSLARFAEDMLAEAEHLFDQEQLAGSTEAGKAMRERLEAIKQRLRRAREIMGARPGSAVALLQAVLIELDSLSAARDIGSL